MKQPYPFFPLQDSLIGTVIFSVFNEDFQKAHLQEAILSHIPNGETYFFTPRAKKQTILDIYPNKLRTWIQQKNNKEIEKFFWSLLKGELTGSPAMDIALELFEWLLTGFQEENICKNVLKILTNNRIPIQDKDLQKIQTAYLKILAEENLHLSK